jgi:hypothetical protein
MRYCGEHGVERPPQVRVQRILEIGDLHVFDRASLNDASIVDQHIDAAVASNHALDRALNIVLIAHIAGEGQHLGPP